MTRNVMPTAADFDAWTSEDEEKALEATAAKMKVKHLIKDGSVLGASWPYLQATGRSKHR